MSHKYLRSVARLSKPNFLDNNEYWFLEETADTYWLFKRFTVRVQMERATNKPELLISYNGISKIWKQNLEELTSLGIDTHSYGQVLYNKKLYLYGKWPDHAEYNKHKVYPILNPGLMNELNIPFEPPPKGYKYQKYFDNINEFFDKYLNTDQFKEIIPHKGKWKKLPDSEVLSTSEESNMLMFGQGKKGIDPYYGIKDNGPYKPAPHKHIKFFLIVHEDEKETAQLLGRYFLGERGHVAFSRFLKLTFTYQKDKHIIYNDDEDPLNKIREQLNFIDRNSDTKYLGIFLSPFDKNDPGSEKRDLYALLKEELLNRNITSQFIKKDNILRNDFKWFISNLGVAMLAKLDGIPWRLDRPIDEELIIGVGAFKSRQYDRYLGSAFCFSNDGTFKGFDCFTQTELFLLAGSIKEGVEKFYEQSNKKAKRLVIHFYKTMSQRELTPILKELDKIEPDIPVVIVTVNKNQSNDIVFFDNDFEEKVPMSGTYISIGNDKYLLCSNPRLPEREMKKNEGRPLPIKLQIKSTDESIINDPEEIKKLIDQVYQFTRMNWSSIPQSSIPVTLKYPEMIARIFPRFTADELNDLAKENMWFL